MWVRGLHALMSPASVSLQAEKGSESKRSCLNANPSVQVSVSLPSTEVVAPEQKDCYAPAMHWADVFWNICLQRCAKSCSPAIAVR